MFVEPPVISRSLTFCSLSRNQISNIGACELAGALQVNQSLQKLKWVQSFISCFYRLVSVFIESMMYVLCTYDALSMFQQGLITTQGVILYSLTDKLTHNVFYCVSVVRYCDQNIPYTKWRGLLSHLSSLLLCILQPQLEPDQRWRSVCT